MTINNYTIVNNKRPIFESKDGKIKTYIVNCSIITESLFKPWRLNRPVDTKRVHDIQNYLLDYKPEKIEGEIFCAKIESERKKGNRYFEVYDGNHRVTAIKNGFNSLCPDSKIIVTIIEVRDDKELLEHFIRINKMVPLSEVDLIGDIDISRTLHEIAKKYCNDYNILHSIKNNPNRPYFNRDKFVNDLYTIYTTCNMKSSRELLDLLDKVNNKIRNDFKELLLNKEKNSKTVKGLTISKKMYITASECNCYIFLQKNIAVDLIEFHNNSFKY